MMIINALQPFSSAQVGRAVLFLQPCVPINLKENVDWCSGNGSSHHICEQIKSSYINIKIPRFRGLALSVVGMNHFRQRITII